MEHLVTRSWPQLKVLKLWKNQIGARGVEILAASRSQFPALEKVRLSGNDIGVAGLRALRDTPEMSDVVFET